jgi:hypothetical protein
MTDSSGEVAVIAGADAVREPATLAEQITAGAARHADVPVVFTGPGGTRETTVGGLVAALAEAGIEADVRRLLSLEQEYVFTGPVPRAGDVLETRLRFDGITAKEGRRGGRMVFMRFVVEFHGARGVRAECRYTSPTWRARPRPPAGGRRRGRCRRRSCPSAGSAR